MTVAATDNGADGHTYPYLGHASDLIAGIAAALFTLLAALAGPLMSRVENPSYDV